MYEQKKNKNKNRITFNVNSFFKGCNKNFYIKSKLIKIKTFSVFNSKTNSDELDKVNLFLPRGIKMITNYFANA